MCDDELILAAMPVNPVSAFQISLSVSPSPPSLYSLHTQLGNKRRKILCCIIIKKGRDAVCIQYRASKLPSMPSSIASCVHPHAHPESLTLAWKFRKVLQRAVELSQDSYPWQQKSSVGPWG